MLTLWFSAKFNTQTPNKKLRVKKGSKAYRSLFIYCVPPLPKEATFVVNRVGSTNLYRIYRVYYPFVYKCINLAFTETQIYKQTPIQSHNHNQPQWQVNKYN